MAVSLVDLLAAELKQSPEEVAPQLSAWVEKLLSALTTNGTHHIAQLGTFELVDGKISFTADETFALEINYKYAGMNPISLGEEIHLDAASSTADAQAAQEIVTGKVRSDEPKKLAKPVVDEPAPVSKEEASPIPAQPASVEVVVDRSKEHDPELEKKIEEKKASYAPKKMEPQVKVEQKVPLKSTKELSSKPVQVNLDKSIPVKKKKDASRGPSGWAILGVVAALLVIIWFIGYVLRPFSSDRPTASTTTAKIELEKPTPAPAPVEKSSSVPASVPATATPPEAQKKQDDAVKQSVLADLSPSGENWGLTGAPISAPTFYSIVVHSLGSRTKAQQIADGFTAKGYRMIISEAVVQEKTYYRVGFGQFQDIPTAQQAVSQLPLEFQGEGKSFIRRIQR